MLKWKQTTMIAAIGVGAFVLGRALPPSAGTAAAQPEKKAEKPAQPEKKPDAKGDDGMAAMMELMQPGAEHKQLDTMVGEWEGSVKFWMTPDGEPMESKGKVKREWVLDGRFVKEDVDADAMGQRFLGLGYTGYNTVEKKYESVWMENMSTYIGFQTGSYDAAKKSFTFVGEVLDPMTNKRVRQTTVVDVSNPDREVMTGSCPGPDGKAFKNFEGVFERKKK